MTDDIESLDEEEFFYYTIDGYDKIYSISHNCLKLFPALNNMLVQSQGNSESNPIVLYIIPQKTSGDKTVYVNHPDHHDFIQKYIQIWKKDLRHENYLLPHMGDNVYFKPILFDADRALIDDYIKSQLSANDIFKQKKEGKISPFMEINILSPLVATINGFLLVEEGLKHKLCGYIADNIRECSYVEFKSLMEKSETVAEFERLQEESLQEWLKNNPDKMERDFTSVGDLQK